MNKLLTILRKKHITRRTAAVILVFSLLISVLGLTPVLAEGDEDAPKDGGFSLSLKWSESTDPANFRYDSSSRESRYVRLRVSYRNKEVLSSYDEGQILISVPGINDAGRNKTIYPVAIAADSRATIDKIYDWSYSYNEATNTYSFLNNAKVINKTEFEGMFEIVWKIDSATSLHNYTKTLQAKLLTSNGETTQSNEITYSQTRAKDIYTMRAQSGTYSPASRLYSSEGMESLIDAGKTADDYRFVRYSNFRIDVSQRARSLQSSPLYTEWNVWVPVNANLCDSYGRSGASSVFQKTDETKTINGMTYCLWKKTSLREQLGFIVAYPNDTYLDKNVTVYLEGVGRYYDETEDEIYTRGQYTINTHDFEFEHPDGVYAAGILNLGIKNTFTEKHCADCKQYGAVNSINIVNGSREYESILYFSYKLNNQNSFEFGLDIIEALTTANTYRQLEDDEYNITAIKTPALKDLKNINGFSLGSKSYQAEIYVRRAGSSSFELYNTVTLDNTEHKYEFEDTDIVGVTLKILDLTQSVINLPLHVYYVYHTDHNDLQLDNGIIWTFLLLKRYAADGHYCAEDFGGVYDRAEDAQLYGYPVYRETDRIDVILIPNELKETVKLICESYTTSQYIFSGEVTDVFSLSETNTLEAFSVYTIIPEDLKLQPMYNTPEKLMEQLSIEGLGLSESFLKSHASLQILHKTAPSGKERTYLEIKFDLGDRAICNTYGETVDYTLTISDIPLYADVDEIHQQYAYSNNARSYTFTMTALTLMDQDGVWYTNSTDNQRFDGGIWSDIDRDGNTSEAAAVSTASYSFTIASYAQLECIMSIQTGFSNGYVIPDFDDDTQTFTGVPETYGNSVYSYRIKFRANEESVGKMVFVDPIEDDELTEWKGTFRGIDVSRAAEFLHVTPVVYYSEGYEDKNVSPDLTDTSKWKRLPDDISDWTQEQLSKVKTIAVDFLDATISESQYIYFDIYMTSPEYDPETMHRGTITVNSSAVNFRPLDIHGNYGDIERKYTRRVAAEMTPFKGTLTITKSDAQSGELLSGAVFELYDYDTNELVRTNIRTDRYGFVKAKGIPYGRYLLVEKSAPRGYVLPEEGLEIVLEGDVEDLVFPYNITNTRKESSVELVKTSDRDETMYLEGAEFRLHNPDGSYYNDTVYVTDGSGRLTVEGIPWGSYYLEETKAPKGFTISDSARRIEFEINALNDSGHMLLLEVADPQIPATAVLTKYEEFEDGTKSTVPVSGAAYELYTADDTSVGTYITDDQGRITAGGLSFGSYYFVETAPAAGYNLNSDPIPFTLSAEDYQAPDIVLKELTTYDTRKPGRVWLEKKDDEGEIVQGAVYGLFRQSDDTRVDNHGQESDVTFVTGENGTFKIENIWWGDYYLKELRAPVGYALDSTKHNFSVNRNTVPNYIKIDVKDNRLKGSVRLIKTDSTNNLLRLANAEYSLYKSNGELVRSGLITGADGTVEITDIPWGSYYLLEDKAPEGYGISDEKIRFSVTYLSAGKVQEIIAEDKPASGEIRVKKRIKTKDVVFAHGNPTFIFRLEGYDTVHQKSYTAYKSLTFSEEYIRSHLEAGDEYAEMTAVFADIPVGTCNLSEVEVQRYEVSDIAVLTANGVVNNDSVDFEISVTALKGEAIFTNNKSVQSKASHTSAEVNMLKRARKVTTISAVWRGGELMTDTVLDREQLDVYVIYDDGTTELLPQNGYELWNGDQKLSIPGVDDFVPGTNMEATIEVRYSRGGRTYKDYFAVHVNATHAPYTFTVTEEPFTENGVSYAGTAVITGYLGDTDVGVITLPSKVKGKRTLINNSTGEYADEDSDKIYKVVKVASIADECAYGFNTLAAVNLPSTVTEIGPYTFYGNKALEDINLENIVTVGAYAFYDCDGLASVTLTSAVELENYAFYQCSNLLTIDIGPDILKVGKDALTSTKAWSNSSLGMMIPTYFVNMIIDKNKYVYYNLDSGDGSGTLSIPYGIRTIAYGACAYSSKVYSVSLPSTLRGIGTEAFYNCTGLTSITIPANVVWIGERAFSGAKLQSINVNANNRYFTTVDGVLYSKDMKRLIAYPSAKTGTSYTIPASVEVIEEGAFVGSSNLQSINVSPDNQNYTSVNGIVYTKDMTKLVAYPQNHPDETYIMPDSVTEMEPSMFTAAKNLKNLTIGNGLTGDIDYRFMYNNNVIETIVIGDNVRSIGEYAFYSCTKLRSVTLGSSITSIGRDAFYYCTALEGIDIPDSVTSMGDYTFYCSGIQTLTIGSGLTDIPNNAFYQCSKLTNVVISEGVKTIGDNAFNYCRLVNSITIPDSVTSIGKQAFQWCDACQTLTIGSGVKVIGESAFTGLNETSLTIPDSVVTIGKRAFSYNRNLVNLTIGSGVKTISDGAFDSNSSLVTVVVPDNVTSLGSSVFSSCTKLKNVTLPSTLRSIPNSTFSSCTALETVTIPSSVTSIGNSVFSGCTSLTQLVLPSNVRTIGESVFNNCKALRSLTLNEGLRTIGKEAFYNCTGLQSLTIPDSVTTIGEGFIRGCTGITSIHFGKNLQNLSDSAINSRYSSPTALTAITVDADNQYYTSVNGVLYSKDMKKIIAYPASRMGSSLTIPNGVTEIAPYCFSFALNLTGVNIPSTLKTIGPYAFYHAESILSITIPDSVETIGDDAFEYCKGMQQVYIGNGVSVLPNSVFYNCKSLKTVTIPDTVEAIGSSAFGACEKLETVSFSSLMTVIPRYAFYYCKALKSMTIPEGVTSIGDNAFNQAKITGNLIVPLSVTSIDASAFSSMTITGKVYLPSSMTGTYGLAETSIVRYSDPGQLP